MNEVLRRRFAAMGADVELNGRPLGMPTVDVAGSRFLIRFPGAGERAEVEAVDVDRAGRHLLLLVRNGGSKSKFLCGHDERHWFVAAVPESARGVTGVATAKQALQPELVQGTRHIRQGEWFFVPEPTLQVQDWFVLRNEPIRRGDGSHTSSSSSSDGAARRSTSRTATRGASRRLSTTGCRSARATPRSGR